MHGRTDDGRKVITIAHPEHKKAHTLSRAMDLAIKDSLNLTLVMLNKLPCPLLIFSQSVYLIRVVDTNSNTEWQAVQIQIRPVGFWLLQKPTGLDLQFAITGYMRDQQDKG